MHQILAQTFGQEGLEPMRTYVLHVPADNADEPDAQMILVRFGAQFSVCFQNDTGICIVQSPLPKLLEEFVDRLAFVVQSQPKDAITRILWLGCTYRIYLVTPILVAAEISQGDQSVYLQFRADHRDIADLLNFIS